MDGAYSLVSPKDLLAPDLFVEIEGFRKGWYDNLLKMFETLTPAKQEGFLTALYALRNNSLPPAYLRSLPIARFQTHLALLIGEIERGEE